MSSQDEIRVLLVEDDPLYAKLVRRTLATAPGGPFVVDVAQSLGEAIAILSRGQSQVAVVDLGLPDVHEPLEAVDRLVGFSAGVPVVVLTGRDTESLGLEAVQCGAHDFMYKMDLSAETLGRSVRYAVERTRLFEQQRALVAKNPDAILILDERASPRFVNPSAERMFGSQMEAALEAVAPLLSRGNGDFDLETDRGTVTLEAVVTEMFWTGQPSFLVTLRDTTARTRTAELRAMLSHADKLASLGQLAADVVQTVAGPATAARQRLASARSLLQASNHEDEAVDHELESAERALQAISAYVRQLENYGQVDRKVTEIDFTRVANLALDIVDRHTAAAVQTRLDPLPRVLADGGLLCHALVNILDNAGDAIRGRTQGGLILLSSWSDDTHVGLAIQDNGPGIPEKDRPNIFRPFFTTKPAGAGTGLGLSVAHDILRAHNGEIRVTTGPDGTRFEVALPRRRRSG